MLETTQLAGDGGQCSGNDRLVESGEKETQHQPAEDQQDLTMGHWGRGGGCFVQ